MHVNAYTHTRTHAQAIPLAVQVGFSVDKSTLKEMMAIADTSRDGLISREEWEALMCHSRLTLAVCVESRERSLSTVEINLAEMTIALPDAIEVSSPADDAKTPEEGTTAEK